MKMLINGLLKEDPVVAVDPGYFYGYGVFETILVRKGQAVLAKAHLRRLNLGLRTLGINRSIGTDDLEDALDKLGIDAGVLKVNVSEQNVVYSTRPVTYTDAQYVQGARLTVSSVLRNPTSPSVKLKSMNYLDNLLELKRAKAAGLQDVIFVNDKDEICETAVANIFFIRDGRLITPEASSGLLEGTVRAWILEKMGALTSIVKRNELRSMEGAFITNSVMGIMKVAEIDGYQVPEHPLTEKLRQQYLEMVDEATAGKRRDDEQTE